jgi:hypothetical protein
MSKLSLIDRLIPPLPSAAAQCIVVKELFTLTPDILRHQAQMDFVPCRGSDGRISFIAPDYYAELIAAGKWSPGRSLQ